MTMQSINIQLGSPPSWEDAPAEFQADLAAVDRLEDDALWQVARGRVTAEELVCYDELLYKNANEQISPAEKWSWCNCELKPTGLCSEKRKPQ